MNYIKIKPWRYRPPGQNLARKSKEPCPLLLAETPLGWPTESYQKVANFVYVKMASPVKVFGAEELRASSLLRLSMTTTTQSPASVATPSGAPSGNGNVKFSDHFRHWRSGKIIYAKDHGKKAFPFPRNKSKK